MLTRRTFLQRSSLVALAPTIPLFLSRSALAADTNKDRRILVVIQMDGGNDSLNTVVPFTDPNYARLRPKLKIESKNLLKLSDSLGLHPSMKPLDKLLEAGQLAVLPGVGYPNPNRSHFESMSIWNTARLEDEEQSGYGWIGRALDPKASTSFMIGGAVPNALRGSRSTAVALNRIEEVLLNNPTSAKMGVGPEASDDLLAFVRRQTVDAQTTAEHLAKLAKDESGAKYPNTGLADRLKLMARLMKADLGARVFYTLQTGFDTHANQAFTHSQLLSDLAGAVAAFFADLKQAKLADRVTLLAFSEFGRTIQENGSAGTDHGTAGSVFVVGEGVQGGVHGQSPNLTDLEGGEPKMTTDFRRIYSTILEDWLAIPAQQPLGDSFKKLTLFR